MKGLVKILNEQILYFKENIEGFKENEISDGYHTFNELYEFRKMYNAALFNEWGSQPHDTDTDIKSKKYHVHKSWRHHDGEMCFGGGVVYCFCDATKWFDFESLQSRRLGFI